MLFNNIIEKRTVKDGIHNTVLEMTSSDYNKVYNDFNNEIAEEIISNHFIRRGDDGRPTEVQMEKDNDNDMVRIYAKINYLGNHHSDYNK